MSGVLGHGSAARSPHAGARRANFTDVSRGVFPVGCRWRNAQPQSARPQLWDVEAYEFWDEAGRRWAPQRPAACTVPGQKLTAGWACPV